VFLTLDLRRQVEEESLSHPYGGLARQGQSNTNLSVLRVLFRIMEETRQVS
jgi:hypothetical protein